MKTLTERELAILRLSATGWNINAIAKLHNLSSSATKASALTMRKKLGAVNMNHAIHLGHKAGLLGGVA